MCMRQYYYYPWPVRLYSTLPHYSRKWNDFKKKIVTKHEMHVLAFSTTLTWNASHFKRKWAIYDQKCILAFMQSTCYSCHIFIKLHFSSQFLKNTQIKNFRKIHPVGAKLFLADSWTDRWTDRHDTFLWTHLKYSQNQSLPWLRANWRCMCTYQMVLKSMLVCISFSAI